MREQTAKIRDFILANIGDHPFDISAVTAAEFDISRQAVSRHLRDMKKDGLIDSEGSRNKTRYFAVSRADAYFYNLPGIDESLIYINDIYPKIKDCTMNVIEIVEYIFTEMANNANDHSGGASMTVVSQIADDAVYISVADDGVGIFKKIADALDLPDEKLSILELAKGKFTTDPERHSGEGIFFSAKASDFFSITSNNNFFTHFSDEEYEDFLFDTDNSSGTTVAFKVNKKSTKRLKDIFDQFSDDEYGFTKTVVSVELLRIGSENLVSRSQAKRLVARFEKFKNIVLDFKNVESIGQAFADEVFRVFQNRYPDIRLTTVNTSKDIDDMVKRAIQR
jgi:DNA-binding transcriptional ArsR family regulator